MSEAEQRQAESLSGTPTHVLILAAITTALVLVTMLAIALWHLRSDTFENHARELNVLSLAVSDEIARGLEGVETGMRAVSLELVRGLLATGGTGAAQALDIRAEIMPLVQSLWLVDSHGRVLVASSDSPAPDLHTFSPALERLEEGAVAVSRPFDAGTSKNAMVALGMPFTAQGTRGWIIAAMPASTLLGAFTAASQAPDARMAMFRDDGVRLAGTIVAAPTLDETGRAKRLAAAKSLELRHFADGAERLVSVSTLPRYRLKLVLTRDWDKVLFSWRGFAHVASAVMALIILIMAGAVYLVQRASRQHAQARQAAQTAAARTSRLQSLGSLAGGVAHDFNNALASILGFAEMARDGAADGSRQARHIDRVLQATQRGKSMVERILTFSRGGAKQSAVFELEPVIDEVLTLLTASLPPGVVVVRRLDVPGAKLRGDSTQIFEAVMNLCTNAMQAMPQGGMLTVQLMRAQIAETRPLSHTELKAGRYLVLSVSDQGGGISSEVMDHLFEPFFTTRGTQSGTGLGLAVVFGAMAEIGGAIDVHSTEGQGARFSLYFPESLEAVAESAQAPTAAQVTTGETILIVDDDPVLVTLTETSLKSIGYNPEGFSDPIAALQAFRETPRRFAAVITDEVMNGLSGTQLAQQIRVLAPTIPILLISGYGGVALAARAEAAGITRLLAKPLKRADLARALADLLQEAPTT